MERRGNKKVSWAIVAGLLAACAADAGAPQAVPADAATVVASPPAQGTGLPVDVASPALSAMRDCAAPATAEAVPDLLSDTGCFTVGGAPSGALVAFEVNAPLWTDGADKQRFMSVPAGSPLEEAAGGDFTPPVGSVLVKTMSMDGRRIETRLLMHLGDGSWRGFAYEWSPDQTDAYLVPDGDFLPEVGHDGKGWEVPSSSACNTCHTPARGFSLGLERAQLDREVADPATGAPVNQLQMLEALGLVVPPTPAVPAVSPLADWNDASAPLGDRARSYLHANCSSCHVEPQGFCTGDLAAQGAFAAMGICDVRPQQPAPGWDDAMRLVAPGDPTSSAISHRMHAEPGSTLAMPPMGRRRVHDEGAALIDAWIASLTSCEE